MSKSSPTKFEVKPPTTVPGATSSDRKADYEIHPLFIQRWSPRAFTGEEIPDAELFSALEAARWAPSGSNAQPWRFVFSKRDSSSWPVFLDLLNPGNRRWAERASALILFVSKKTVSRNGEVVQSKSHSFDTGAAWQNFALQALLLGWHTHGMGGFDREKARTDLKVPDDFTIEAVIAIGRQGDKSALPAELQEREFPNSRQPLKDLALEGGFSPMERGR
jgi:nitroreductase